MNYATTARALLSMSSGRALSPLLGESLPEGAEWARQYLARADLDHDSGVAKAAQAWLDGYHMMQALEDGQAFLEATIEAEQEALETSGRAFEDANDPDTGRRHEAASMRHSGALDAYQRVLESIAVTLEADATQALRDLLAETDDVDTDGWALEALESWERARRAARKIASESGEVLRASNRKEELKTVPEHRTDAAILKRFRERCLSEIDDEIIAASNRSEHCAPARWAAKHIKAIDVGAWLAQDENAQNLAAMAADKGARE